jgi:hypothetical protein
MASLSTPDWLAIFIFLFWRSWGSRGFPGVFPGTRLAGWDHHRIDGRRRHGRTPVFQVGGFHGRTVRQ